MRPSEELGHQRSSQLFPRKNETSPPNPIRLQPQLRPHLHPRHPPSTHASSRRTSRSHASAAAARYGSCAARTPERPLPQQVREFPRYDRGGRAWQQWLRCVALPHRMSPGCAEPARRQERGLSPRIPWHPARPQSTNWFPHMSWGWGCSRARTKRVRLHAHRTRAFHPLRNPPLNSFSRKPARKRPPCRVAYLRFGKSQCSINVPSSFLMGYDMKRVSRRRVSTNSFAF